MGSAVDSYSSWRLRARVKGRPLYILTITWRGSTPFQRQKSDAGDPRYRQKKDARGAYMSWDARR